MFTPEQLKPRRAAAKKEFDSFQPLREEAYRYAIPYRRSTREGGTGETRVDQTFDHTAIDSAFRFAGKLQQDLWPTGQENFALEPGPIIIDAGERDQLAKQLAPITKVVSAFFDDPDWDMAFHEMAIDLSAGTGAMLMNSTSDPDRLWEPMSVPVEELMLEAGANGKISAVFWDRKMPLRVLFDTWPEGKFGAELKTLQTANSEKEVTVHVDVVWQRGAKAQEGRWHLIVWCDEQKDDVIFKSQSRTSPWLLPRYFRVAGETYGRGLVHLAMPSIKTVNTAARLQLQAAAIAMLGIYTAVDDGVFNPDLSPVQPGAFWKVSRNGGTMGRSVERFPDPRLDLTQLVMQDLRQGVKSTMMDDDLPMAGEAVKSPTEILERIKKANSNHIGAFGRLVREVVVPAVKRVIELAYEKGLIGQNIPLDQLLIRVKVKSPLAVARAASRVQKNMEWLQMVIGVEAAKAQAPGIGRIAKLDEMLINAGRELGIDEAFLVSTPDRAAMDEKTAQQQQLLALAQAAGGAMPGAAA